MKNTYVILLAGFLVSIVVIGVITHSVLRNSKIQTNSRFPQDYADSSEADTSNVSTARKVEISLNKNQYKQGERIVVHVNNMGGNPVATEDFRSACSIVWLQRKSENHWIDELLPCRSKRMKVTEVIEANSRSEIIFSLLQKEAVTGSGFPSEIIDMHNLPTGFYRIRFDYSEGNEFNTSRSESIFSNAFQIH